MTADDYIRETSLAMTDAYIEDCVTHVCRVAELLLAERRFPWVGRVRRVIHEGGRVVHAALIPKRFAGKNGPTWTTHYVTCSGRFAYDPLIGAPIDTESYVMAVFGEPFDLETHLDAAETERLLIEGGLKRSFRPK